MLKKFYRTIHVSRDIVKINKRFLFDKKRFRFLDLSKVKPNLIILGSQKCGTTSLHNYLNEHPDIFMSTPIKEPDNHILAKAQPIILKMNVKSNIKFRNI